MALFCSLSNYIWYGSIECLNLRSDSWICRTDYLRDQQRCVWAIERGISKKARRELLDVVPGIDNHVDQLAKTIRGSRFRWVRTGRVPVKVIGTCVEQDEVGSSSQRFLGLIHSFAIVPDLDFVTS